MNFEIDYSLFQLKQEYFDHESTIHGINHTYRVMCLVLYIGHAEGLDRDVLLGLCAAFIHDFARKHDGFCDQHGLWATQYKLPEFISLFKKMGVSRNEFELIDSAVKNHSELQEIDVDHDAYKVAALLKDADALDRIRLGENNLNEDFLRFPESIGLMTFAKQLYLKTQYIKISSFVEIIGISKLINH